MGKFLSHFQRLTGAPPRPLVRALSTKQNTKRSRTERETTTDTPTRTPTTSQSVRKSTPFPILPECPAEKVEGQTGKVDTTLFLSTSGVGKNLTFASNNSRRFHGESTPRCSVQSEGELQVPGRGYGRTAVRGRRDYQRHSLRGRRGTGEKAVAILKARFSNTVFCFVPGGRMADGTEGQRRIEGNVPRKLHATRLGVNAVGGSNTYLYHKSPQLTVLESVKKTRGKKQPVISCE